jgi:hypothetical protein
MYTLTHEPLALAGVAALGLVGATLLILGAAVWIRSIVRATDPVDEAIDAAAALVASGKDPA